jgi:hypothetical protein
VEERAEQSVSKKISHPVSKDERLQISTGNSLPHVMADVNLTRKSLSLRLAIMFVSMIVAQAIGSAFNIWYNLSHIVPLLKTDDEVATFETAITWFNLTVYPPLVIWWAVLVFSLRDLPRDGERARRRVINLPWIGMLIAAIGWILCIPTLMIAMRDVVNRDVFYHLPVHGKFAAHIRFR